jgi:hypothetical protein
MGHAYGRATNGKAYPRNRRGRLGPPVEMATEARGGGAIVGRVVGMTIRARGFGPAPS